MMNFEKMTTDELKDEMPPNETTKWEYKDAALLLKEHRDKLKTELEVQTSAFANSGGGFLVFGVKKGDLSFQPCPLTEGNGKGEPMEEWLAKRIQTSVEYPLFGVKVHPIKFTNDPENAVFVVEFPDSPKAPHQAKTDKKYYWRTNYASEPAPHYFLDALRSRPSKATLEIEVHDFRIELSPQVTNSVTLHMTLYTYVTNTSFVTADGWCVHAQIEESPIDWGLLPELKTESSLRPPVNDRQLLPDEIREIWIDCQASMTKKSWSTLSTDDKFKAFTLLKVRLKPASHNFVGQQIEFSLKQDEETETAAKVKFRDLVHK